MFQFHTSRCILVLAKHRALTLGMAQNITGPGRPGRDDQTSLMGLAAESMGWDYPTFLQYMLGSAQELGVLRNYSSILLGCSSA